MQGRFAVGNGGRSRVAPRVGTTRDRFTDPASEAGGNRGAPLAYRNVPTIPSKLNPRDLSDQAEQLARQSMEGCRHET